MPICGLQRLLVLRGSWGSGDGCWLPGLRRRLLLLLGLLWLLAALVEVADEPGREDSLEQVEGRGIFISPEGDQVPAERAVPAGPLAHRAQQVLQDGTLCRRAGEWAGRWAARKVRQASRRDRERRGRQGQHHALPNSPAHS